MWKLELSGTLVHFFLLISIFDIHLPREVYRGLSQNCNNTPLAKRLVLIIINGLDTEEEYKFIKNEPFLKEITRSGIWGWAEKNSLMKSNGITAITGGFEQNPRPFSAIYEHRSTEFDHIFNYASITVYIGKSAYLDYFSESSKSWIKLLNNGSGQNNATLTDEFVQMFQIDTYEKTLLHDNIIIFVSLTVSTHEQSQKETSHNQTTADIFFQRDINKMIKTVEKFYNDKETTFIFCSDNAEIGKSEKSNELFMMWGKGVHGIGEVMINMKDLSLMISTVLGNPIPLSSTGVLHKSYLTLTLKEEASANACNALHLSSIANETLQQVGNKLMQALHLNSKADSLILEEYQNKISRLLTNNNYSELNDIADELTTFSLKILEKDVIFMKSMIFYLTHLLFIGWAITLLLELIMFKIKKHPDQEMRIQLLRKKTELWFFGMHTLLILLGTTSVLFIIVKDWPLHYMFYWLITLSVWGFVLGNLQTWTGLMDNLNVEKLSIILLYILIYGGTCETFIWGLKYKLIFCVTIITVTIYNWIKSYITNKSLLLKISLVASGLAIAPFILLSTVIPQTAVVVIITSLLLPVMSVICAYYMRFNPYDFLVMTISTFLSCISLIITSFKLVHPINMLEIISWTLFLIGMFLPIFGGLEKTNRLQHIAVCYGANVTLFSQGCEPLIVIVVFSFCFFWYLNDKPRYKITFLNRYNSFQIVIFTVVTFVILHLLGTLDQNDNHFTITGDIFEKIKLILILLIALTPFTALKHESGGDSQFVVSIYLLHYCSYRLFLEMQFYDNFNIYSKQLYTYCNLQLTIIILFVTHSFSKFVIHASLLNLKKCLGELCQRMFTIRIRNPH